MNKTLKLLLEEVPNCWEYNGCTEETYRACPAYPHKGKECWKVTGLCCAVGRTCSSFSEKILHCRNGCEFYRKYLKPFFK